MKRKLIFCCVLLTAAFGAQAQSYVEAMKEIALIGAHFRPEPGAFVRCKVDYTYALASDPSHNLDSLSGVYRLCGKTRYTLIGHTETIQDDSIVVVAYHDDHVLMAGPHIPGSPATKDMFFGSLDTAVLNKADITLSKDHGVGTITLRFPDSARHYNCTLVYDLSTHVPGRMTYTLPGSALVTMHFSDYNREAFDTATLSIRTYIRVGADGKAQPQPAFSGYRFIQTANFPVSIN